MKYTLVSLPTQQYTLLAALVNDSSAHAVNNTNCGVLFLRKVRC